MFVGVASASDSVLPDLAADQGLVECLDRGNGGDGFLVQTDGLLRTVRDFEGFVSADDSISMTRAQEFVPDDGPGRIDLLEDRSAVQRGRLIARRRVFLAGRFVQ